MAATVTVLFISYLLGSTPSAIWVGKAFKGIDVREHGSGNAGTTNTFRVLGVPFGVTVFVLDFMKGFVSSFWISGLAFFWFSGPLAPPNWDVEAFLSISCGMAAVFGHMFPVFAGFKGGKGAATACGMLFGIEPISIGISFALFGLIVWITRYVSLASIVSTAIYPLTLLIMRYGLDRYVDGSIIIIAAMIAFGIIYKHKVNIGRLIAGTENKVGAGTSTITSTETSTSSVN